MTHPRRPVSDWPGVYPITTFYVCAVAVLVLTDRNFFTLQQGVLFLGVAAIWAILIALWRDLKAVHTLVNGQKSELMTEIADLKLILRQSNVQVPPSAAEKRDQTKEAVS